MLTRALGNLLLFLYQLPEPTRCPRWQHLRNQQMLLIPVDNEHRRSCSFCQAVGMEIEKLIVFMLLSLSGELDCPIQFLITLVFNSEKIYSILLT